MRVAYAQMVMEGNSVVNSKLSDADQLQCWDAYCRMLATNQSKPVQGFSTESQWAAHWDNVFSLLDGKGAAEDSADADASAFSQK